MLAFGFWIAQEIDFASRDVGAETVFAFGSGLYKASEETAFISIEGRRSNFSDANRCVDVAILRWMKGRNRNLARSHFKVFIALDLFHFEISREHANAQVGSARDFDADLKVVLAVMAVGALNGQFSACRSGREVQDYMRRILVASSAGDVDRILVGGNDFEAGGSRFNGQQGPRLQRDVEALIAWNAIFSECGKAAGEEGRSCDGTHGSHEYDYARAPKFVPCA
jgi:hypothetical protein